MALLDLTARVQADRGGQVLAVTVDHALRAASADEARWVGAFCASRGIAHQLLRWDHGAIRGNLQDQARQARYRLIADWVRGQGIGHVLVGHTADDLAESFLIGLARAAGIDGLTSMRPRWQAAGLHWARPLLGQGRVRLRAYLTRRGIPWVDDPSNEDDRFTRIRARRGLAALAPLGISTDRLADVVAHLSAARAALEAQVRGAAADLVRERAGELTLDRARLLALPDEVQRRLLSAALRWMAGAVYPPRAADLARVIAAIHAGRHATLMGARVRVAEAQVSLQREYAAVAGLATPTDQPWDAGWRLTGPHAAGLTIRALGAAGLARCGDWRAQDIPRAVLLASPAIWRGDALISAPLAGFGAQWLAERQPSFHSFLLSD